MSRSGISVLIIILVGLFGATGAGQAADPASHAGIAAQLAVEPTVVISALELADSVRYSITILRPGTRELRDVRMAVTLPMDADSVEAFETPGYTRFRGNDGGPLRWEADRYVAYENVDPFTFLLRQPPSGDFAVSARWSGGGVDFRARPPLIKAGSPRGEIVLGPADTGDVIRAVGDTGVGLQAAPGTVPEGTRVRVQKLDVEANPPLAVGDLWWCAMLEIEGLPAGTALEVVVPARRPLPPGTIVSLFAERDGRWESLEAVGRVADTGQHIELVHPGGRVAAGTLPVFQPQPRTSAGGGVPGGAQPRQTPVATSTRGALLPSGTPGPSAGGPAPGPTPVRTVFSECFPGEVIGNCSGGLDDGLGGGGGGTDGGDGGSSGFRPAERAVPPQLTSPGSRPGFQPCSPAALGTGQRCANGGGGLTECNVEALTCSGSFFADGKDTTCDFRGRHPFLRPNRIRPVELLSPCRQEIQ